MATTDRILEIPTVEGLEFDDPTHTYRLDGLIIPSVSAILGPLSKAKYSGISERTLNRATTALRTGSSSRLRIYRRSTSATSTPSGPGGMNSSRRWSAPRSGSAID